MALFELLAKIKIDGAKEGAADVKALELSVHKAAASMSAMDSATKAHGSSVTSVMASIKVAAVAASVAIAGTFARKSFDAAADYDSLVRALATSATSAEDLQAQLGRLRDVARMPGIGFEEAVKGSIQLQAVGISAQLAERSMAAFANAVARAGGSKADFGEAMRQMTQTASAGKLLGENLKVIAERVPGFSKVIQQAFGTMDNEKINAMGLSSTQLVEKITAALEKMPKATGGIRNAMDNLSDTLNQKLYAPLGRIPAAFASAFGPALERMLNAAAPGFDRMASAMERLSKTSLATFFNSTIGNLKAMTAAVSVTTGVLVAMAAPRVITSVVSGVMAMVKAFQALRVAIQSTAIADIVMEAIATKGASLLVAGAAISAGVGVAIGLNKQLNDMFASMSKSDGSTPLPAGLQYGGGTVTGLMGQVAQTAVDAMSKMQMEKLKTQERIMLSIERNTAKTAGLLDMRRQTLGGGDLGKLGVTAAELRSDPLYSPPDTFSRPASAELERVLNKQVRKHGYRTGTHSRPRAA